MSASDGRSTRWRRRTDVLHRRTAYGPLVLTTSATDPATLSGDLATLWSLLDEPADETTLTDRLADATKMEPTPAATSPAADATDIREQSPSARLVEALATLRDAGIIEPMR